MAQTTWKGDLAITNNVAWLYARTGPNKWGYVGRTVAGGVMCVVLDVDDFSARQRVAFVDGTSGWIHCSYLTLVQRKKRA